MKKHKVTLIHEKSGGWYVKMKYPRQNPIIIARSRKRDKSAPRWLFRLYMEVKTFNSDIDISEVRKYIRDYMREGHGKFAKPLEVIKLTQKSQQAKVIGYIS